MNAAPSPRDATIVLVITRVVRKGCDDRFRVWAGRVAADAAAAAGHAGELQLEQAGGVFHVAHRFASAPALARWEATDSYARLMAEGDLFSTSRRQVAAGPSPRARLPCEADQSKWKRFVMTWLSVLPIVTLLNLGLHALPLPLPAPVQSLISSIVMVALMTWLILPAVSRRLAPWALRDGDGDARIDGRDDP